MLFRFRHRVRSDESPKARRLTALHSRRFWARGPYFRIGRAYPDPAAFTAFIRIPCSRERRSHVVGPDGDPSLPGATGANRACRRRILLRFKAPSRSAPHEQDAMEYIPRSENVKMWRHPAVPAAFAASLEGWGPEIRPTPSAFEARHRASKDGRKRALMARTSG